MNTSSMTPISCTSPPQALDGEGVAELVERLDRDQGTAIRSRRLGSSRSTGRPGGQRPGVHRARSARRLPRPRTRAPRRSARRTAARRAAPGRGAVRVDRAGTAARAGCSRRRQRTLLAPALAPAKQLGGVGRHVALQHVGGVQLARAAGSPRPASARRRRDAAQASSQISCDGAPAVHQPDEW